MPRCSRLAIAALCPVRRRRARARPRREGAGQDPALRRRLPGEPLVRQPLRRLGEGRRPRARRRRAHAAGRPGRRRRSRVPAAERREPAGVPCRTRRSGSTTTSGPTDTTCPTPGVSAPNGVPKGTGQPGGCTRDLVHRFYQEQYQLNGGRQNRYVTGSDAIGLTMGTYDTRALPIYAYLHRRGHQDYAISDRFFQAAFGGSFLNHQWLVAAATPTPGPVRRPISTRSSTPTGCRRATPLYTATGPTADKPLTVACPRRDRRARAATTPSTPSSRRTSRTAAARSCRRRRRHDRRPPERQGHRLGVVLRRLVERQRRRRRPGLDERHHAGHLHGPRDARPARCTRTARTRCSSSTTRR